MRALAGWSAGGLEKALAGGMACWRWAALHDGGAMRRQAYRPLPADSSLLLNLPPADPVATSLRPPSQLM